MFYDYLMTQFFPYLTYIASCLMLICVFCAPFYIEGGEKMKKATKKVFFTSFTSIVLLLLLPDVDYIKHYYGEARPITQEQKTLIQRQYEMQYKQDLELFIKCLDKGMKQPTHATFNDTNEVVNTCHQIAKQKFN